MTPPEAPRKMVCIGCPLGCPLEVVTLGEAWEIRGYTCKKGKEYGEQEVTDPRRMVTTTVAIDGALWSRLPVRSAQSVPKDSVDAVCRALHQLRLTAPVAMGDVVLEDALETGVAVVATRSLSVLA